MDAIMTDVYVFDLTSRDQIADALKEQRRRSIRILEDVFGRGLDTRRDFENWFEQYQQATNDPELVLHEDPADIACRYLGVDSETLTDNQTDQIEKIATIEQWYV